MYCIFLLCGIKTRCCKKELPMTRAGWMLGTKNCKGEGRRVNRRGRHFLKTVGVCQKQLKKRGKNSEGEEN
jgi:hypothetical protein